MSHAESAHHHLGTAIVTGAGSAAGIGFATARLLGLTGLTVILTSTTDRVQQRVDELQAAGIHAVGIAGDLTDPAHADRVAALALERTGRIDILVNNAGLAAVTNVVAAATLAHLTDHDWANSIGCNLTTAFTMTRAVLPTMVERGYGRVVNVSSVSGPVCAFPGDGAYHAAKAGLVGLTRSVAIDYAGAGITCNAVAPGWIVTDSTTEDELAAGASCPLGRSGTADEVAHAILMLTARAASYITGQCLVVDGGNSIQEDHRLR